MSNVEERLMGEFGKVVEGMESIRKKHENYEYHSTAEIEALERDYRLLKRVAGEGVNTSAYDRRMDAVREALRTKVRVIA